MEAGFWNANSRTNEIAFKFGTELTSTSRRFDRFAPEAVPQMLIPRIERSATGRRKIRGLSNEPTPLPKHRPTTNTAARPVRPAQIGCCKIFFDLSVHIVHTPRTNYLKQLNSRSRQTQLMPAAHSSRRYEHSHLSSSHQASSDRLRLRGDGDVQSVQCVGKRDLGSLILMPASDTELRRQVDTRGFFAKESSQALVLMFRKFPDGVLHTGSW